MKRIAHIIPSEFPATHYGGTERVVENLAKAQKEMGFDVSILCNQKVHDLSFASIIDDIDLDSEELVKWASKNKTDLLHFHSIPPNKINFESIPHIVSIHGNGQTNEIFPTNSIFVSKNHAERHNSEAFVYNGIDLSTYPLRNSSLDESSSVAFLAKASWKVKNLKGASSVINGSNLSLEVMGGKRPLKLWAFLNSQLNFHGMVGAKEKLLILQNARALLFPVLWHEPFGMAVIEAMATGLPVIGTPFGALPEIITPETGIISTSKDEMRNFLMNGFKAIDPEKCRQRVEENFSHHIMANSYNNFYEKVLSGESINSNTVKTISSAYFNKDLT